MTLLRQLIALVMVLLLLVFMGTFAISIRNTQSYLEAQLVSHAQDAATSLGLSISSHLAEQDIATVTSMSNAIFDRGYYRMVRVEDIKGSTLVDLVQPVKIQGIPDWFISTFPLETPVGEAAVMAGWSQAGKVFVQSHPGYAYVQLWHTVTYTASWFLACALFILMLGMGLLRWVLQPLKRVEQQADSICNREFTTQKRLPRTRDLRRMVEAMNRLSEKVQGMLSDLDSLVGQLRQQAYNSQVTGLANKRYFLDALADRLDSSELCSQGVLCLIQLKGFKDFNDKHGYQAGDRLLLAAAQGLERAVEDIPQHILAHLSGADFALLVEECSLDEASDIGRKLSDVLTELYATGQPDSPDVGHVGMAYYDGRQSLKELLSQADMALRSAQGEMANGFYLSSPADMQQRSMRGVTEWRHFIEEALAQDRIVLHYQPVVACPSGDLLQREVLVRIAEPDGELVTAGLFMPTAENFGLTVDIDRAVIARVLESVDEVEPGVRVSINISPQTLQDSGFVDWLEQALAGRGDVAGRLIFEMPEYVALARLDLVKDFISRIGPFGVRFSLDHFGRSFSSLAYLHSLKIHYIKVDGSYLRTLDENRDHQFFVQALADIAHGLDIKVIAESVESEAVWDLLPSLHFDAAQGYFIGRPE